MITHPALSTFTPPIPILPIPSAASLLPTLTAYATSLTAPLPFSAKNSSSAEVDTRSLLAHGTVTAPHRPLSEPAVQTLVESVGSLAELARIAEGEAGRESLIGLLGREGEGVVRFWAGSAVDRG